VSTADWNDPSQISGNVKNLSSAYDLNYTS